MAVRQTNGRTDIPKEDVFRYLGIMESEKKLKSQNVIFSRIHYSNEGMNTFSFSFFNYHYTENIEVLELLE